MLIRALKLLLGVGEERFEVVVGGRDAIDEVFKDECEPEYIYISCDGPFSWIRYSHTCGATLAIPWRWRTLDC